MINRLAIVLMTIMTSVLSGNAFAAVGRTPGQFAVSPTGSAQYTIPIWAPPGPRGVQPHIALTYNSQSGNGPVGVGWGVSGLGAISRCNKTYAQDTTPAAVALAISDGYCLNGNRLRLTGGTYGTAGSTYQTEIADFSNVTANGAAGNGPAYFTVRARDGLTYEYGYVDGNGNGANSQVLASGTADYWLLSKVIDRAGNNLVVNYTLLTGTAVPNTILWTPTSSGAPTYAYTMTFNYSANVPQSSLYKYVAGTPVTNTKLLTSITVASAGTIVKNYVLGYQASPTTGRDELTKVTECADSGATTCLLSTNITYQAGTAGVAITPTTAFSGGVANTASWKHDLNGDGYPDIVYENGTTMYVAFGSASGYGTPVSTGIAYSNLGGFGDVLGRGLDGMLANNGGTCYFYTWDGTRFSGVPIGVSTCDFFLVDVNGDGLPDMVTSSVVSNSGDSELHVQVRLNTSSGGTVHFGTANDTRLFTCPACNYQLWNPGSLGSARFADFNGDGRQDMMVAQHSLSGTQFFTTYYLLLANGTNFSTVQFGPSTTNPIPPTDFINWNNDACTDILLLNSVYVSGCNGTTPVTIPISGSILTAMDWDGDGRTDVLVVNGSTVGVYLSTGNNLSMLQPTSVPYSSACYYFTFAASGDGLDSLGCLNNSITYFLRNGAGIQPDLVHSIADGFGNSVTANYTSIARSNYQKQADAVYPYQDYIGPLQVVYNAKFSDPSNLPNGTFSKQYYYYGAWTNLQGRGFSGFNSYSIVDSRTTLFEHPYYERAFPYTGMMYEDVWATGTIYPKISQAAPATITLDSTANNQRYFPYFSGVRTNQVEVGGSENGIQVGTAFTAYTYDNYGNATTVTTTVTDEDPSSPYLNEAWTSTTTNTISPNTTNWCLNLPTQTTVTQSNTSAGGAAITRTVSYPSPDYTNCRQNTQVVEPASATYKVTTAYGYDAFGNLNSSVVTGVGMTARSTGLTWGATGQFLTTVTNPLSQTTTFGYDSNSGMLTSVKDPNALTTSWQYDNFARKMKETRPDTTSTTWAYNDCATAGCVNSNNRMTVVQTRVNTDGTTLRIDNTYLDALDRTLVTSAEMQTGAFNRIETQYDSLGHVHLQGAPCMFTSCTQYWTTNTYDVLHRLSESQRPISATNSTLQSTIYSYQGRMLTVTDPQSKVTKTISHVTGDVGREIDHNGYYVNTNRDAFGSVTSVTDSLSNTLKTATYKYGAAPFVVSSSDMDLGSWSYTVDALGEMTGYTDAKSQSFSAIYDALSRPTQRTEPDLTTTWTWGSTAASYNIGKLQSVSSVSSAGTYADSYTYDNKGRLSNRTIALPIAGAKAFDYSYNATSELLEFVTFPPSYPSTYRVTARYQWQNGILQAIWDGVTPTTTWWQSNSTNPAGQITQETTTDLSGDPHIVSRRTYDAVTHWVSSIQTGVSSGSALQNESYLYDLVGNVTQRQSNNAGLTENFYYDNLYRLDHSVLGSTTNLQMAYDAMGNITSRSDVAAGATWTYDPTHKHEVTQAGSSSFTYAYDANGNAKARNGTTQAWTSYNYPSSVATSTESADFDYGPDRQRWRMTYDSAAGIETTYYATPAFEQVATSTGTDYRHYLYAAGRPVVVISRNTAGAVNVRSLLTDHQGSVSTVVTDSTGASYTKESFTAYGNRRDANTWSGAPTSADRTTMDGVTREGYTFQTVLGSMGLNHMNGRVQDAVTGRFLSADPYTASGSTQSYNPYSYVNNNPLTLVDPSGFADEPPPFVKQEGGGDSGGGSSFGSDGGAFDRSGWSCYGNCGPGYWNSGSTGYWDTSLGESHTDTDGDILVEGYRHWVNFSDGLAPPITFGPSGNSGSLVGSGDKGSSPQQTKPPTPKPAPAQSQKQTQCTPSKFTMIVGGSVSLVPGFGGQASGGLYGSSNGTGQGAFTSAGVAGGVNVGANAFVGFMLGGPTVNLAGRTDQLNLTAGFVAVSLIFQPDSPMNSQTFTGMMIGPAAGFGFSASKDNTTLYAAPPNVKGTPTPSPSCQ